MRKASWWIGLSLHIAGLTLIAIYGDWRVAVGVFLVVWANSIELKSRSE